MTDLAPGSAMDVDLTLESGTDTPVAVVRTDDGEFYAIGGMCTHGEVPLGEGDVEGCFVECWAHGSRFDVRTGEPDEPSCRHPRGYLPRPYRRRARAR
ncbi:Rieske 2Fe-2S domain-containing protein [Demequina litorisediminis]|uniref:Rieske domain-containing protein n=1 Tax=Demequina litorisediminis TaxID=1849022 RepID=A0ABQ6IJT3_9MICO|nr:hypothetical protein GCM10025876_35700 [Demequina litorisediminis]